MEGYKTSDIPPQSIVKDPTRVRLTLKVMRYHPSVVQDPTGLTLKVIKHHPQLITSKILKAWHGICLKTLTTVSELKLSSWVQVHSCLVVIPRELGVMDLQTKGVQDSRASINNQYTIQQYRPARPACYCIPAINSQPNFKSGRT